MKAWLDDERMTSLDRSVVAIVRFNADRYPSATYPILPQPPAVHFQVTISPENVSASGRFIRFGQTIGDELVGWFRRDIIFVEEIIGTLQPDGKTVSADLGARELWNELKEEAA